MNRDGIAESRSSDDGLLPPSSREIHVWRLELPADGGRAAARAARNRILGAYLGEPGSIALAAERDGKPRLAEAPERLSFNLSHSGRLALLAIAPGETGVGIDIERIQGRRDLPRLAARWLPADDATAIATAPPGRRETLFYAAWTRHEARVKCTGTGLAGAPPGPEVHAWQIEVDSGYAAAVALEIDGADRTEPRIVLKDEDARR
jgi:4'-phosphopantetheinyl transferase